MGRICYIHIGMHKTGSSAIQQSLEGYDDGKTSYCDFGDANHSLPLSMLFLSNPAESKIAKKQRVNKKQGLAIKARAKTNLEHEFGKKANTIISSEALSMNFSREEIEGFVAYLEPHYDQIRVMAYVRPAHSFAVSSFQQRVQGGKSNFEMASPNYRNRFGPWIKAVGKDRITFVKYDRSQLVNNDVVDDFCDKVGVDVNHITKVNANKSISAEAIAVLYCHNKFVGRPVKNRKLGKAHSQLVSNVRKLGGSKFTLSPDLMEKMLAEQTDDIAWMEKITGFALRDPLTNKPDQVSIDTEEDIIALADQQAPHLEALLADQIAQLKDKHSSSSAGLTDALVKTYLS